MKFSNRLLHTMPVDPIQENYCRYVKEVLSLVQPTPVSAPQLLAVSSDFAVEALGFTEEMLHSDKFLQVVAGNDLYEGMQSYAHCYGGHQFGHWAGQLGDGRAIALGEISHKDNFWELQLKGAGVTPYSRMGDGRAVLRSSLREFVCSEAMHALGIPTTRALSLVSTGDTVLRDMMYDGNSRYEPGAIVCRVAESFLRFGNLEIVAERNNKPVLQDMLDFIIHHYYPQLVDTSKPYVELFHEICIRTATLIAQWMGVGFVHGVMNTDNMSVLGLTIDYGPYGWLDIYDEGWTPNTSDEQRKRYRYGNQPEIGGWNVYKLAQSLHLVIPEVDALQEGLRLYQETFASTYTKIRYNKLGFVQDYTPKAVTEEVATVINDLYALMGTTETDMTILFRKLMDVSLTTNYAEQEAKMVTQIVSTAFYQYETWSANMHNQWQKWILSYVDALHANHETSGLSLEEYALARIEKMRRSNPKYIFRNYLAQMAIEKAERGDNSMLHDLQRVLRTPFDEHHDLEKFAEKMPAWARNSVGCSQLSCSS